MLDGSAKKLPVSASGDGDAAVNPIRSKSKVLSIWDEIKSSSHELISNDKPR